MTRYKFLVGTAVVAFTLSVTPAWSQGRPGGGGGGGGGGGEGRPGGGAGGGGGPAGVGSGGGGGGGGSMSSGGGGGSSSSAPSSGGGGSMNAPSRPNGGGGGRREGAPQRRSGDGASTGQRAVPRGASGETRGSARVPSSTASGSDRVNVSADRGNPANRAVPTYSRPRDGRPVTGQAQERTGVPGGGYIPIRPSYPYYPYYGYGRYYWPSYGYGFGLGFYYDPFWYDPFYYGGGGGYGYGYGGYASGSSSYGRRDTGALRLKIKPRNAQVFVDGYFVGTIDSFDGMFQKLGIDAGGHRIEIKAEGYEPLQFEVLVTPGETATYKGELKRIQ
jgi:hypothetical protein